MKYVLIAAAALFLTACNNYVRIEHINKANQECEENCGLAFIVSAFRRHTNLNGSVSREMRAEFACMNGNVFNIEWMEQK